MMKLFSRFTDKKRMDADVTIYRVEGIVYTFKGRK